MLRSRLIESYLIKMSSKIRFIFKAAKIQIRVTATRQTTEEAATSTATKDSLLVRACHSNRLRLKHNLKPRCRQRARRRLPTPWPSRLRLSTTQPHYSHRSWPAMHRVNKRRVKRSSRPLLALLLPRSLSTTPTWLKLTRPRSLRTLVPKRRQPKPSSLSHRPPLSPPSRSLLLQHLPRTLSPLPKHKFKQLIKHLIRTARLNLMHLRRAVL